MAAFTLVEAPWSAAYAFLARPARQPEYSRCTEAVEIVAHEARDGHEVVKSRETHKTLCPFALAEIRRVLRAGGRLSVSEQFPEPDLVTPRSLRRELSAAGFVEERTRGWLFYTATWSAS